MAKVGIGLPVFGLMMSAACCNPLKVEVDVVTRPQLPVRDVLIKNVHGLSAIGDTWSFVDGNNNCPSSHPCKVTAGSVSSIQFTGGFYGAGDPYFDVTLTPESHVIHPQ